MPPSQRFTREDVLRAALAVAEARGIQALTARDVARRLKASVAPVYRHFRSMALLKRAVFEQAGDLLLDYTRRPYTDRPFLNQGTGVVLFARDHSRLFRSMFLEENEFRDLIDAGFATVRKEMPRDPRLARMTRREHARLLAQMSLFTMGLAAQVCAGLVKDARQEAIIRSLVEVGSIIIPAALAESEGRRSAAARRHGRGG